MVSSSTLGQSRRFNSGFAPFVGASGLAGRSIYVAKSGKDSASGLNPTFPKLTVSSAIAAAVNDDTIFVGPGIYDETLTVPLTLVGLKIEALGHRRAVIVLPTTTNADGVIVEGDYTTLVGLDVRADGTGNCLQTRGKDFLAMDCKFGTAGAGIILTEFTTGSVGTQGTGERPTFFRCEIQGVATGVVITATTTQNEIFGIHFEDCWFYDLPTASFEEAGGDAVSNHFRNLLIKNCHFGAGSPASGSPPTKWILLNDNSGNTGEVVGCSFPTAINGGLNLVSTNLDWVGNLHTGGLSTAQPS